MSRILNRQRQLAEAGRLRCGYSQEYEKDGKKKSRPVKSEKWIVTSHSQEIVDAAAALWGGTPERWQPLGNGAQQWRVITDATAIDAILPPGDPLTQAYETWSAGGAQRRCDGVTEQFSGSPCLCQQQFGEAWFEQPKGKVCDTKTRLKVLLPDMPGLGSYRVETGSFYGADEIAGMIDTVRSAVGDQVLVPIRLRIEPRTRIAGGQTKHFIVPVVELRGVTTGQLLARADLMAAVGAAPRQQIESGKPRDFRAEAEAATSVEAIKAIWFDAQAANVLSDELGTYLTERAKALDTGSPDPDVTIEPDEISHADAWADCVRAGGEKGWSLGQIKETYAYRSGGDLPQSAEPSELVEYAAWIRSDDGQVAA